MNIYSYTLPHTDIINIFSALQDIPYSLLLDSARQSHPDARYSYVCFLPIETIESKDGQVRITNRDQQLTFDADPFKTLQDRLELWGAGARSRQDLPPFQGGAAGMFGYDLARNLEKIPSVATDDPDMPDMAIGLYDQVIACDHFQNTITHIIQTEFEEDAERRHRQLLRQIETASGIPDLLIGESVWLTDTSADKYKDKVEKVIDYIRAGDIFQANISQRFRAQLPGDFDPFAHYCRLRKVSPAPFAAYMNFGDIKISSASPECFLTVKGRQVRTRPIKGTRPRDADPVRDQGRKCALEASRKDRAENAMIVDLLRNDLSKCCEDHSVNVDKLCDVESFAQVHHLVSTVTGRLRADKTALDLLAGCFPGGSITGAPKVRAMEIIEDMEPARRGPYCGALGYVGFNGNMNTNIAIRTLVYKGREVSFNVGGGIVADSDPAAEYQETLDKAESLFQSFDSETEARKDTA